MAYELPDVTSSHHHNIIHDRCYAVLQYLIQKICTHLPILLAQRIFRGLWSNTVDPKHQ